MKMDLVVRCLLPAALLAACSGRNIEISVRHNPDADFTGLKTYAWLKLEPSGDPQIDDERVSRRVLAAVDKELAEKGYTTAAGGKADFSVIYHVVMWREMSDAALNDTYGYKQGSIWTNPENPMPAVMEESEGPVVREYHKGSLILDILDPKTKRLMWRGTAEAAIDLSKRPDAPSRDRKVREAVKKMLERFPPE